MKIVKYFRNGKIDNGLEVSKKELMEILEKLDYVSISESDKLFKYETDDNIVGTIIGDIYNIVDDLGIRSELVPENSITVYSNKPTTWFVNKDNMKLDYKPLTSDTLFTLSEAMELMKLGYKVARTGWNGKGMFIFLFDFNELSNPGYTELTYAINHILNSNVSQRDILSYRLDPVLVMKTATGSLQFGWLASQADMLAEDYVIVM